EKDEDNGLVDMAYISEDKLLTLERSYDARRNKVTAKIYMTDLKGAVDYSNVQSFQKHSAEQKVVPVKKKLVLDLDDLLPSLPKALRKIDNIEGIAIGPKLPNGNSTILLVSDNNF